MPALNLQAVATIASLILMTSAPAAAPQKSDATIDSGLHTLPRYEARFVRTRPVIAVIGYNEATEITDFVVPYGVLAQSGVGDVLAVSTQAGPIQMSPSLRFGAHATLEQFEARHPDGADYVIVPNIYEGEDHAPLLDWLRRQAQQGATIVGICDGVKTVANTGLLEGRRATTHWRSIDGLERKHPGTQWTRNTRYIADGKMITTSGVSASIPISVALVEAIAGRERAAALGRKLGVPDWSSRHNSVQFRLTAGGFLTALGNKLMFWRHENLGIDVAGGADEIRIAVIADAWGRTRRSMAYTVSSSSGPITTLGGLVLLPDRVAGKGRAPSRMLPLMESVPPVQALDRSLEAIASGYGGATADFVALTMEYEWK